MVDAKTVESVHHLIIFDQTFGIESADPDQRVAAKPGEGTRNQQQAVRLHPCIARQEIADILIRLEPLEDAARARRWADRAEHAGRRRKMRFALERLAHG